MTHNFAAGSPSSDPLYKEIRTVITSSLANGEWKPGNVIPSEFSLAESFGVSKGTVRRALDELVSEKILVRRQGRGTFVATHSRDRTLYHFLHILGRDGKKEYPAAGLISYRTLGGDETTCDKLDLEPGSKVIIFRNLVKLGGTPVFIDDIVIAHKTFQGLTEQMLKNRESTIYALYQSCFNINVIRISEQLSAGRPPPDVAQKLGIARSTPVLVIARIALTYHDKPVELRKSWVNTESYVYLSDLRKS